jgi:hypothetical protein
MPCRITIDLATSAQTPPLTSGTHPSPGGVEIPVSVSIDVLLETSVRSTMLTGTTHAETWNTGFDVAIVQQPDMDVSTSVLEASDGIAPSCVAAGL